MCELYKYSLSSHILSFIHLGVLAYGGPRKPAGLAVSLYFIGIVVIGNYVLLNVFLAIAVDNLTEADIMAADDCDAEEGANNAIEAVEAQTNPNLLQINGAPLEKSISIKSIKDIDEFYVAGSVPVEGGTAKPGENLLENLKNPGRMTGNIAGGEGSEMLPVTTLFCLPPTSSIRVYLHMVVASKWFDPFILGCILVSSLWLAFEDTVDENALANTILMYADFVFTPIFFIEVVLKIMNYGLLLHKGAYLRDPWNVIDAIVVAAAVTSLILSNIDAPRSTKKVVKILKLLRVLRPLKSVNKSKKLKAVFQCMIYSVKNVFNIFVITIMFLFVFAAMGVQLFNGQFSSCTDPSKVRKEDCVGRFITFKDYNYYQPIEKERVWNNQQWNFDNVANGMLTLFTSSTGEGWPNVMFNAIDATGKKSFSDLRETSCMRSRETVTLVLLCISHSLSFVVWAKSVERTNMWSANVA